MTAIHASWSHIYELCHACIQAQTAQHHLVICSPNSMASHRVRSCGTQQQRWSSAALCRFDHIKDWEMSQPHKNGNLTRSTPRSE